MADENLTWKDMISRIAIAAGRSRKVHDLPAGVVRGTFAATGLVQSLTGKQSGLHPARMADLMLRELFVKVDKNWQRREQALERLGY